MLDSHFMKGLKYNAIANCMCFRLPPVIVADVTVISTALNTRTLHGTDAYVDSPLPFIAMGMFLGSGKKTFGLGLMERQNQ